MDPAQMLANIDPVGMMGVSIPLVLSFVPIVAIVVKHQQKMAEIIHGSGGQEVRAEVAQLRGEVYELKQMLHQQMIAMDSIMSPPPLTRDQPLQQRLEQTK